MHRWTLLPAFLLFAAGCSPPHDRKEPPSSEGHTAAPGPAPESRSSGEVETTSCDELRKEVVDLEGELGACSPGDSCVSITVLNDCLSGALVCGIAVESSRADEARSRAEHIAGESLRCNPCSTTQCVARRPPICDAAIGRCVYPPRR